MANSMKNQVVFAAAGNGKTYTICKKAREAMLNSNKCILLLSYTNEGVHALETEYKNQNLGVLDERIVIKSWYRFLLSDFIKPYQCLLHLKEKKYSKELDYHFSENYISSVAFYSDSPPRFYNQTHYQYFVNSAGDVYPDRTSHLAILCNEHSLGKAANWLESIYSHIFIDELQDYAGWDLEIIKLLFNSSACVYCVGDYKQATYRTNNSPKNRQYRDENIRHFFAELERAHLCDVLYSNSTRRFNQEICDYINTIHKDPSAVVYPDLDAERDIKESNCGVYLVDINYLAAYCNYYHPTLLRYDKNAKVDFTHECNTFNYGGCKGATYDRTVIIPVSTVLPFINKQDPISSNQTKAKFYVACTRARYSVVIAMKNPAESKHFKTCEIVLPNLTIPALKFHPSQAE